MADTSVADFCIRALQAADVPTLRAVLPEWVPEHWNSSGSDSAPASQHHFRVLVRRVHGGGEFGGIAEFQQIMDEGHLLSIAIVPAFQRHGLGTKLLNAVLEELRAAGCRRCLLEVRRSNVAAQALYRQAQFTLDGVRKEYYPALASSGSESTAQREDALLYSRPL